MGTHDKGDSVVWLLTCIPRRVVSSWVFVFKYFAHIIYFCMHLIFN